MNTPINKNSENKPKLLEVVELFNHSLMIMNLIDDYIVKNFAVKSKTTLLNKGKRASQLISDIHQEAHLMFAEEHSLNDGKVVEKLIHDSTIERKKRAKKQIR